MHRGPSRREIQILPFSFSDKIFEIETKNPQLAEDFSEALIKFREAEDAHRVYLFDKDQLIEVDEDIETLDFDIKQMKAKIEEWKKTLVERKEKRATLEKKIMDDTNECHSTFKTMVLKMEKVETLSEQMKNE
jgi:septal ring factor EnvC (AmiA/AmiB activator)